MGAQRRSSEGREWPVDLYLGAGDARADDDALGSARKVYADDLTLQIVVDGLDAYSLLFLTERLSPFGPSGPDGTPLGDLRIRDGDHDRWIQVTGARVRDFSSGPDGFATLAAERITYAVGGVPTGPGLRGR